MAFLDPRDLQGTKEKQDRLDFLEHQEFLEEVLLLANLEKSLLQCP
jgi:hypothetical protein